MRGHYVWIDGKREWKVRYWGPRLFGGRYQQTDLLGFTVAPKMDCGPLLRRILDWVASRLGCKERQRLYEQSYWCRRLDPTDQQLEVGRRAYMFRKVLKGQGPKPTLTPEEEAL